MNKIFFLYYLLTFSSIFNPCSSNMNDDLCICDTINKRSPRSKETQESLKCKKLKPKISVKLMEKVREFNLDDRVLFEIQNRFSNDIDKALRNETHHTATMKCYVTYVQDLPTGIETGKSLAIDLSGATFSIHLTEFNKKNVQTRSKTYSIPKYIMHDSGEHLFDHVADCLYRFMESEKLLKSSLPLGFTFGFPLFQKSLTSGILKKWTKDFNCTNTVGKDVVELLQDALNRRGLEGNVRVRGIINDTTGTLLASAYRNSDTRIGVIISTGSNACYLEKQSNVELFDGFNMGSGNILINTEWGAFGDDGSLEFVRTNIDREVDAHTNNPGKQLHEKMISGMYMGEIVRLILVKLIEEKLLFGGVGSDLLQTRNSFHSKYVSEIELDQVGAYTNCIEILSDLNLKGLVEQDYINVRYVCETVSKRSAYLVASGISALLNRIGEEKVTIGIDGSVYKYHPVYHQHLVRKIYDLVNPDIDFELKLSEDGNGLGASLIAVVADEYHTEQ